MNIYIYILFCVGHGQYLVNSSISKIKIFGILLSIYPNFGCSSFDVKIFSRKICKSINSWMAFAVEFPGICSSEVFIKSIELQLISTYDVLLS